MEVDDVVLGLHPHVEVILVEADLALVLLADAEDLGRLVRRRLRTVQSNIAPATARAATLALLDNHGKVEPLRLVAPAVIGNW